MEGGNCRCRGVVVGSLLRRLPGQTEDMTSSSGGCSPHPHWMPFLKSTIRAILRASIRGLRLRTQISEMAGEVLHPGPSHFVDRNRARRAGARQFGVAPGTIMRNPPSFSSLAAVPQKWPGGRTGDTPDCALSARE